MYCSRLFVVVFQEMNCLHMTLFVVSQSFVSPPSFIFVSAAVSEICELKQNKKKKERNSEIGYSNLTPFLSIQFLTRGTF